MLPTTLTQMIVPCVALLYNSNTDKQLQFFTQRAQGSESIFQIIYSLRTLREIAAMENGTYKSATLNPHSTVGTAAQQTMPVLLQVTKK